MHNEVSQVFRERDAARVLGVSLAALRRWRREHRGPAFVRIEGCIGYLIADIQAFLAENTVRSSDEGHE